MGPVCQCLSPSLPHLSVAPARSPVGFNLSRSLVIVRSRLPDTLHVAVLLKRPSGFRESTRRPVI
jgi:hypothetical protein